VGSIPDPWRTADGRSVDRQASTRLLPKVKHRPDASRMRPIQALPGPADFDCEKVSRRETEPRADACNTAGDSARPHHACAAAACPC
jgi:hypothetical protein